MLRGLTAIIILLHTCAVSFTQVKVTRAVKVTAAPRIDGSLDDLAWKDAPIATDFITRSPAYGKPASEKTEVRVVYDNNSVYIGAYIYDDPASIRKQFTSRDNDQLANVDYFAVFL